MVVREETVLRTFFFSLRMCPFDVAMGFHKCFWTVATLRHGKVVRYLLFIALIHVSTTRIHITKCRYVTKLVLVRIS